MLAESGICWPDRNDRAGKPMTPDVNTYPIAVAGAGPAGLAAAILAASHGLHTLLLDQVTGPRPADKRTSALMQGSIRLLRHIGVWQEVADQATPLWVMRLTDHTGRRVKARDMDFDAHELGEEPFGWNIANEVLVPALRAAARAIGTLEIVETAGLKRLDRVDGGLGLTLAEPDSAVRAELVLGADGRQSVVRSEAGIPADLNPYDQTALVTTFAHERSHEFVSIEFHRPAGPLTLVPMAGKRSSLVWIEKPAEARRLMALDDGAFSAELEAATDRIWGGISGLTKRQAFPIRGMTARRFADHRVMLIGEAAHVIPPIGAQGLNLGFRDAALAAELIGDALKSGIDLGDHALTDDFDRRRRCAPAASRPWRNGGRCGVSSCAKA
jgi:2-octaprenyl-6-methoxyphenol hydroxylase